MNQDNNKRDSFEIFLQHYQREKSQNNNLDNEAALASAARAFLNEVESSKNDKNNIDPISKYHQQQQLQAPSSSSTTELPSSSSSSPTTTTSFPQPTSPPTTTPFDDVPSQLVDGDIAMMVFATTFVMLMTPAAGVAQAGQIRRKNALSMLMQTLVGMCIGSILWYIVGFALVFGDTAGGFIGNPFGSIGWFLRGVSHLDPNTNAAATADTIPGLLMCVYQLMFAIMTPVIVTGAWAERLSFEAFLIFIVLWPFLIYYPLAHWLWNSGGFLVKWGVLDFAGGIVIHTSSGIAALAVVLVLTRRKYHQHLVQQHHNLPLSTLGAVFIWGGWYSFNGGSAYKANFQAASALLNTHISACCGGLTWVLLSRFETGHWPLSAVINGVFAGLSGITAGSGFVPSQVAFIAGMSAAVTGFITVKLRVRFNLDDVCEVIALQGVPGAVGALIVGLGSGAAHFACNKKENPECCTSEGSGCGTDGLFAGGGWDLFGKQIVGVLLACVWAFVMTYFIMLFIRATVGIEVSPDQEEKGLDMTQIGERAYDHDLAGTGDVFSPVSKAILAQDAEKLCLAAREGDLVHLHKLLLFSQASAKSVNYDLRSPAHIAASHGHLEFLKELHRFGCPLDCVDRWGNTPMSEAIAHGNDEVIAWLISKGINATSFTLPTASHHKTNDGALVVHHTEEYFLNKITNSLTEQFFEAASIGDAATLRRLLAAGIDVNEGDYDYRRALHLAAAEGFSGILSLLLDAGADAAALDRWGHVPLDDAKMSGFEDCIEILKKVTPPDSKLIELRRKHNQKQYGGRATESMEETMKRNASEMMMTAANLSPLDQTTVFPGGLLNGTNNFASGDYGSVGGNEEDVHFYSGTNFGKQYLGGAGGDNASNLYDTESNATSQYRKNNNNNNKNNNNDDDITSRRSSMYIPNASNNLQLRQSITSGNLNLNASMTMRQSFAAAAPAILEHRKEIRQKPRKAQIKERMKYLMMNQIEKEKEEKERRKKKEERRRLSITGGAGEEEDDDENSNDDENEDEDDDDSQKSSSSNCSGAGGSSSDSDDNDTDSDDENKRIKRLSRSATKRTNKKKKRKQPQNSLRGTSSRNTGTNSLERKTPSLLSNQNTSLNGEEAENAVRTSGKNLSLRSLTTSLFGHKTPSSSKNNNETSKKKSKKNNKNLRSSFANARDATDTAVRELCTACSNSNYKEVKRLLKKGADPTKGDYDGRTALHIAGVIGHVQIMKALLDSNPSMNVNVLDRWQRTPLQEALFHNNPNTALLLRKAGGTVVQRKTGHALCLVASRGDLESLKKMHESGVDLLTADYDSRTALHLACCNGFVNVVEWLLTVEGGFKLQPSPIDRFGNSPMVDCIREKQTECFNLLVEATQPTQSVSASMSRSTSQDELLDRDETFGGDDEKKGLLNSPLLGKGRGVSALDDAEEQQRKKAGSRHHQNNGNDDDNNDDFSQQLKSQPRENTRQRIY